VSADEVQRGWQSPQPEGLVVAASEDPARHLLARERGEPGAEQGSLRLERIIDPAGNPCRHVL
jgi:hypothetical protein